MPLPIHIYTMRRVYLAYIPTVKKYKTWLFPDMNHYSVIENGDQHKPQKCSSKEGNSRQKLRKHNDGFSDRPIWQGQSESWAHLFLHGSTSYSPRDPEERI